MMPPLSVRRFVRAARRAFAAFVAAAFFVQAAGAATFDVTNASGNPSTSGSLPFELGLASNGDDVAWTAGGAGAIALTGTSAVAGGVTLDVTGSGTGVALSGGGLSLAGAATLANTAGTPFVIGSLISGAGSLTMSGSGVLTLTGANTYTGGTIFNSGTVNINNDAALGDASGGLTFNGGALQAGASITSARDIVLNANGTFDTNGNSSLLTGLISGAGTLTVADSVGGGVLSLSNASNSYSGGTIFDGGTLSIDNDAELGTGGLTFNGGTLQTGTALTDNHGILLNALGGVFDTAGTTSTLAGLISGVGGLTKISSGTLTLSGANTYTGGTTINGGVLAISSDGNLGGPTGAITLNGGILQTTASITDNRSVALGASGGTIDTDGNSDTFSGAFTGAGSLTKIGDGTLTLSNSGNNYSGGTIVSAGTLQMGANNVLPQGSVLQTLSIASGATFNMNGFSQTNPIAPVTNSGLLNVGTGTLALYSYSGTGTVAVTLGSANLVTGSNTASIQAAGSVNLSNGTVSLGLNDPGVKNGQQFNVIHAVGGLTTNAGTEILSTAAIELTPTLTATGLTVTAILPTFASLATTPNQTAVAGALETLRAQAQANPNGAAGAVMTELYALNTPQIQAAFDQIGPIAYAGMSAIGFSGSSVEAEAIGRRMTALDTGEKTGGVMLNTGGGTVDMSRLFAEGGTDDQDPFGRHFDAEKSALDTGFGFYGSLVGTTGHQQSMNGAAGFEPGYGYRSGGVMIGGDYRINDAVAVGLTSGYLYGHADVYTDAGSVLNEDSGRAGAYAAIHEGGFRADLYAGGALDYFSTNRGIDIGGVGQNATASPTGRELNANGYFTYDVPTEVFGVLAPFVGVNEDRLTVHSFSENGAGALDLNVGAQTAQSLRSSLGIRQSTRSSGSGGTFDAHWSLGWVHEFSDQSRPIDAQLAAGGSSFSVQTASLPADGALVGAGFSMSVDKDTSFNVDYSADVRDRFAENTLQAALRMLF